MSYDDTYLSHHGIKGQKWGVRRFQNEDGSYTSIGKKRYYNGDPTKKGLMGSSKRVRQKQQRILNKIKSSDDDNILIRNTLNDYRQGRIAQLESKARHREAREAYVSNKTDANKIALRQARGERIVKNYFLGNPIDIMGTTQRGAYNRYRSNGESIMKSALKTYGKTNLVITSPAVAGAAALAGAYRTKADFN